METIAFVQGVLSVIGVLMVVGMVWAIRQINNINKTINSLYQQVNEIETQLHLRMDRETETIHQTFRDIEVDIRSQMDSRFDKLINQVVNQKQVLKG